jgi:hypothetical protein
MKTIIIGINNNFSAKANKYLFISTGILFLINGIYHLFSNILDPIGLFLGILMLLGGIYYLIFGIFGFSKNSSLSMKVKVDEKMIELKNSFFKPSTKLDWKEIKTIEFGNYEIVFKGNSFDKIFNYNSSADISIEIKKTLKEFAIKNNVEIR